MVNYLLNKYATDQANTEYDATILRYVQPTSIADHKYVGDPMAKPCKVADPYDEGTLNGVLLKRVDRSVRHSMQS